MEMESTLIRQSIDQQLGCDFDSLTHVDNLSATDPNILAPQDDLYDGTGPFEISNLGFGCLEFDTAYFPAEQMSSCEVPLMFASSPRISTLPWLESELFPINCEERGDITNLPDPHQSDPPISPEHYNDHTLALEHTSPSAHIQNVDTASLPSEDTRNIRSSSVSEATPQEAGAHNHNSADDSENHLRERKKTTSKKRKKTASDENAGPRFKRTRICSVSQALLERHFERSAYPSADDLATLKKATDLPEKTIRTWYSNARSRRDPPNAANPQCQENQIIPSTEPTTRPRDSSPMSVLSKASIDALSTYSPAPSNVSLDRYVSAGLEEEAVSIAAIQATIQDEADNKDVRGLRKWSPEPMPVPAPGQFGHRPSFSPHVLGFPPPSPPSLFSMPRPPHSRAGSSVGSAHSNGSCASRVSIDSRGSKRGRKRWPHDSPQGPNPHTMGHLDGSSPCFCTWPTCNKTFQRKSDWVRHEESVHYCPSQWICCRKEADDTVLQQCFVCGDREVPLKHLIDTHFENPDCASKPPSSRTFTRKDHFVQHIKRLHLKQYLSIPDQITEAWFIKSEISETNFLYCGFCGKTFDSRNDRHNHVFDHMATGIQKSAWWPRRLPLPTPSKESLGESGEFQCPICGQSFKDYATAVNSHPRCTAWSCRFLHDIFSAFRIQANISEYIAYTWICRLCGCTFRQDEPHSALEHVKAHRLGFCDQRIFVCRDDFLTHMCDHHGASHEELASLEAWECEQSLLWSQNGIAIIRTAQKHQPANEDRIRSTCNQVAQE